MAASLRGGGRAEPVRRFERLIHWRGGTGVFWASAERERNRRMKKKEKAIRCSYCARAGPPRSRYAYFRSHDSLAQCPQQKRLIVKDSVNRYSLHLLTFFQTLLTAFETSVQASGNVCPPCIILEGYR